MPSDAELEAVPRLPLELHERIMELLDKKTVESCLLVSRRFHASAQRILHPDFAMFLSDKPERLRAIYKALFTNEINPIVCGTGRHSTKVSFNSMMEVMEQNELLRPSRLLTGYIPGAAVLSAVEKAAAKLKHQKPSLIYLLDPVMGDAGRLYVAPDVIPVYRNILPLATIITPNWFEVETLTDIELVDIPSLQRALEVLHKQYRAPHVVISSIPLKPWLLDATLPGAIKPSDSSVSHLLRITSSYPPSRTAPHGHTVDPLVRLCAPRCR